jgi:hypothetical protein
MKVTCPDCGAAFSCGADKGRDGDPCWCASQPPLASPQPDRGCYCPQCLARRLAQAAEAPPPLC